MCAGTGSCAGRVAGLLSRGWPAGPARARVPAGLGSFADRALLPAGHGRHGLECRPARAHVPAGTVRLVCRPARARLPAAWPAGTGSCAGTVLCAGRDHVPILSEVPKKYGKNVLAGRRPARAHVPASLSKGSFAAWLVNRPAWNREPACA